MLDPATCLVPVSFAGFLLKNRKSPMKGWHKVTWSYTYQVLLMKTCIFLNVALNNLYVIVIMVLAGYEHARMLFMLVIL